MSEQQQPSGLQAVLIFGGFLLAVLGIAAGNFYFERLRIEESLKAPGTFAGAPLRPRR